MLDVTKLAKIRVGKHEITLGLGTGSAVTIMAQNSPIRHHFVHDFPPNNSFIYLPIIIINHFAIYIVLLAKIYRLVWKLISRGPENDHKFILTGTLCCSSASFAINHVLIRLINAYIFSVDNYSGYHWAGDA